MKFKHVFTLCLLVGITFGSETDENKKTTTSTTTAPTTNHTTTVAPSSTTTVPSTTSLAPTNATTTALPTTPSTTPVPTTPSTTPVPTTPSTPPSSTTISPAPTSPPTTPAPSPPKEWIVTDPKTNVSCILARMEVTFNLRIGKATDTMKISPATAKAIGGHCGISPQLLKIVWTQEEYGNASSTMVLAFTQSKNNYYVSSLNLSLAHNTSEGIVSSEFIGVNLTLYETNVNASYSCESVELPQMKNPNNETVDIKFTGLQIEAFRSKNTTSFSSSHYCSGEVPDIVPLVVGIALAALVLVVVIAYLIGRRRSQARGYLSM